jgi:hypothetical protein
MQKFLLRNGIGRYAIRQKLTSIRDLGSFRKVMAPQILGKVHNLLPPQLWDKGFCF